MSGIGRVLAAVLGVLVLAALVIFVLSEQRLNKHYETPEDTVAVLDDPESLERGEYLVTTVSLCVECHGQDLGGQAIVDDPMLGRIVALNLTKGEGGVGDELEDADYVRAIRYGVGPNGKALKIMPADDYYHLSDADLGAIIGYIRSLPPVDNELQPTTIRPFGRLLAALGKLNMFSADRIDRSKPHVEVMEPSVSKEYGAYLANISGCTGCHHPDLAGGQIPGAPPDFPQSANLTPAGNLKNWTFQDFTATLRSGKTPEGKVLAEEMPWRYFGKMSDQELRAIWMYLESVPPVETADTGAS